ncbi:hypothetical protein P167DRAFT_532804 [Morchella conica CCBAS932]|uniref:Peroxisomal biogenesis factor 11 n=1 Tax=Morchella conica CCBAS932 TaxID=1392247 RepID=A0A3N4LD04_9PEZI|nr:hypothetical protein P167DRAFT_532804 [Morchella conica CCBAS932]
MKTPPPSPQDDSPALLYLLALCDPAHDKQTNTYFTQHYLDTNTHNNHNQYNNTPGTMSPNNNNNLDLFAALGGGMPGGGGAKDMGGINIDEAIRQLRKHLPGARSRLHHFLLRMNKMMSTPGGVDKVLMTISYTLQMVSPNLPRGSPLLKSISSLTSLISDIRIFNRLWGLLGIYAWGHSIVQHPPRDLTIRRIVAAQVLVNACFQGLENVAYLASHQVLRISKQGQSKLWMWSSRFWMAHVGLEFWRLQRVREMRMGKISRGLLQRGQRKEEEDEWKKNIISNLAYAPLTLHWSVQNGMIGPSAVGALGSVAAVIGLQNAWNSTA